MFATVILTSMLAFYPKAKVQALDNNAETNDTGNKLTLTNGENSFSIEKIRHFGDNPSKQNRWLIEAYSLGHTNNNDYAPQYELNDYYFYGHNNIFYPINDEIYTVVGVDATYLSERLKPVYSLDTPTCLFANSPVTVTFSKFREIDKTNSGVNVNSDTLWFRQVASSLHFSNYLKRIGTGRILYRS